MESIRSFEYALIDAPLPVRRYSTGRPVVQRRVMFDLLGTMEPGGKAVEVNRAVRSVQGYIQAFRSSDICAGDDVQFVARPSRGGWTTIWRVK